MRVTITLAVDDLQRSAAFYRDLPGLAVEEHVLVPGGRPLLLVTAGETVIVLREAEVVATLHPALFAHLDRVPRGAGVAFEFEVADLRGLARRLERRGMRPLYELRDDEHRRGELWLHDPDGYLIVLQGAL